MIPQAFISWPSAPFTETLVRQSLADIRWPSTSSSIPVSWSHLLQWSTYDDIDHELTRSNPKTVLSSSYTIRKALIRKHFLSRCVQAYLKKRDSPLKNAVPRTWDFEISFADELEEMWSDELWVLGQEMELHRKWWILKPGMADRGMGIRLFSSKDGLQRVFEEFELDDVSDQSSEEALSTAVITSQLRHFVIQEYVSNPLLLDPTQAPINNRPQPTMLQGHKFHLRAYCVASGALTIYLYTRMLALFSAKAYELPLSEEYVDLRPHLTNTCLQAHRGEDGVRLLDELVNCDILSFDGSENNLKLREEDITSIVNQVAEVLAEVFKAALEHPVHFQPLPNGFELYGVDFLVVHDPVLEDPSRGLSLQVKLLEFNAEPAIELTGARLSWMLEDLFRAIGKVCVVPFFAQALGLHQDSLDDCNVGQSLYGLRKCLQISIGSRLEMCGFNQKLSID